MTKIKEDALKEPRKVSDGGRDIRSNYLFCPRLCPSCKHFEEAESNWPYKCSQGTSDNIANRSKKDGYRQYDECKYYNEKEANSSIDSSIDNIVETQRRERKDEDEIWERKQEEKEQQKREFERQRQQEIAEDEYNETHCFYCGEKGLLVSFYYNYFHQPCLDKFRETDKGKKWIEEQEAEKVKRIAENKKREENYRIAEEKRIKEEETRKKLEAEQERQKKEEEEKSKIETENKRKIHKAGTKKRRFLRIIIIILALIPLGIFGNYGNIAGFIGIFSIIFVIIFWKLIGKWTGEFKE